MRIVMRTRLARRFLFFHNTVMTETSKETMRHEAIKHRERIHVFNNEAPDDACALFFESVKPEKGQVVALYWPLDKEFDPSGILERLLKEDYVCALPVVTKGEKVLGFARWREGDPLTFGSYNVQQPVVDDNTEWLTPDIVVVPFLAFDLRGRRLGYGGGYYDATLAALRAKKEILAVGIGYAQQAVIFNLPHEPHDEKLDWVITPQQAHYFGG